MEDETRALFIQKKMNLLTSDGHQHRKPKGKRDVKHRVEKGVKVQNYEVAKLAEVVKSNNSHNVGTRKTTDCGTLDSQKRHSTMNGAGDGKETSSKGGASASKVVKKNKLQKREPTEGALVNYDVTHSECPSKFVMSQTGEICLQNFDSNQEKFVAKELINRLKTENLLYSTKLANRKKIHDPKSCPKCIETEEKIARYEFLKRQVTRVESSNLDRKIDDIIHTTDTIFMIGDLAATLPKHSDRPNDVWDKLFRK